MAVPHIPEVSRFSLLISKLQNSSYPFMFRRDGGITFLLLFRNHLFNHNCIHFFTRDKHQEFILLVWELIGVCVQELYITRRLPRDLSATLSFLFGNTFFSAINVAQSIVFILAYSM